MIDSSDLAKQFERGEEVYISFQYVSREIETAINALLAKILARLDLIFLYDTLEAILREIIQNAVKANIKRVWFTTLGFRIDRDDDYRQGMRSFREIAYHPELMKDKLLASSYRVILKMKKSESVFSIDVINNARIVPSELERIQCRIREANECGNFAEAYEKLYDDAEGAGLGIILTVMLLKNAGLGTGIISVTPDEDSVKFSLEIPFRVKDASITSSIRDRILEDVKTLPTFPESIIELQALCGTADTAIEVIAEKIGMDPSLTADVLRLSNSAGFITGRRIRKISEAVMVIGLNNLCGILSVAATRKILDSRYRKFEQIWEHCNRTAFYARRIALLAKSPGLDESVFVAGLLHDMGKIVLLATDAKLVNQIADLAANRRIRTTAMLEELFIGISHADIGGMVADQWNFPEELVEAIRFHHSPLDPSIRHPDLVMAVYLANELTRIGVRELEPAYIEHEVLARFGIGSRTDLEGLYGSIRSGYDRHVQMIQKSAP